MGEGFFGKVKNLIGIEEIEEEEVVEVEEQEQPKAPVQERTVIEPRSFVQPRKEKEASAVKEEKFTAGFFTRGRSSVVLISSPFRIL